MPSTVLCDWYDTPLYYDIIFDEDTGTEADFLEEMHRVHGNASSGNRSVLELACGSGRLMRELSLRGWRTGGFDLNPNMLSFARDRIGSENRGNLIWEDRMESFTVPGNKRFDLAHCLVSTFKYLRSEEDACSCLDRVSQALKPGGLFVLGLHLSDPSRRRPTHERWVASRDGINVVCNTRTWPVNTRLRSGSMRSRLRVTLPNGTIQRQETNWEVRSYTASQLRRLLQKAGSLKLVACHDFRHDPNEHRKLDDSYSDLVLILKQDDSK